LSQHAHAFAAGAELADAAPAAACECGSTHVRVGDQEIVSAVLEAATVHELIDCRVDQDVLVLPREKSEQFSSPRRLRRPADRTDPSRTRISRPDLCFTTSSRQELAIEPVQVVDGVEQAVARAHAEEKRDLAGPASSRRLTVERLLRRASSTPQVPEMVVVPAPPWRRKHQRRRRRPGALRVSRRAAVRRTAP